MARPKERVRAAYREKRRKNNLYRVTRLEKILTWFSLTCERTAEIVNGRRRRSGEKSNSCRRRAVESSDEKVVNGRRSTGMVVGGVRVSRCDVTVADQWRAFTLPSGPRTTARRGGAGRRTVMEKPTTASPPRHVDIS